jgi:hypothetical protein
MPHVYVDKDGPHISAGGPLVVEVGCSQPITIDKLFGPLIFCDIRVTAEFATNEWVIERKRMDSGEWSVVARVPGQLEDEFKDDDES